MTNTPSKEEVTKAQEWMKKTCGEFCTMVASTASCTGRYEHIVNLLASYAAEQREQDREILSHDSGEHRGVDEWLASVPLTLTAPIGVGEAKQLAEIYAESRLTSLREGLRRFGVHQGRCTAIDGCTCGLATLLAEKKES